MNGTFRDINKLSATLKFLLGAGAFWSIVLLWSAWLQYELLSRSSFSVEEATANDTRERLLARVFLVLYLLTLVVFARWIYRANQNVRALGAEELRFSPGWAVGYFFVPVVALWYPYQAMKDLWRASKDARGWQAVPPGWILGPWWTLWIIAGILGQISLRVSLAAKDIETLQVATVIDLIANLVDVPLNIAALVLVSQIQIAQAERTAVEVFA